MGSESLAMMDSNLPERYFPCLQATKKVSFKVNSGVRDSKVYAGFPVSPVTPDFQSDYVQGLMGAHHSVSDKISSLDSSGASFISILDSEQNFTTNSAGISAPSHLCCEGMNFANTGCHRDSTNPVPVYVVHADNLDAKVLEPGAGLADQVCVQRHEIHSSGSSQHLQHGEYSLPLWATGVDGAPMISQVGMNQQSPHRNVSNVPRPDAQLGLSVERGDEHKGLTWSSVVTKNTLGGRDYMGVNQSSRWLMILP